MPKYLVLFIAIILFNPVQAAIYTSSRTSPYYYNNSYYPGVAARNYSRLARNAGYSAYHPYSSYNSIPAGNLSALEKYALKKNYTRESDIARLARLESLAFGSVQSGDLASRYKNVERAILARPQNNYRHSLLNRISSYFLGQPTGLTPGITTTGLTPSYFGGYDTFTPSMYTPGYSNSSVQQFSNGIFGNGWSMFNHDYGTGGGVKILD